MNIQMIVFDMAGTTLCDADNAVAGAVVQALRQIGCEITPDDVDPVMGMPKPLAIRVLLEQNGHDATDDTVARVHAAFQQRMIEHYRTSPTVREIPGTTELFRELRRLGIRVTLDTGFDRPIADAIIHRLGWHSGLIDDSVTSDEVAHGRPDPEMIRVLMERAGIEDPSLIGKVGDSISDIEQGINAGCGFVGAIVGPRTRSMLMDPRVHPLERVSDLLRVLAMAGSPGRGGVL
jgi:phosphonatase-like hydrolase